MTYDVNYVTCPKCGHDRNSSTATKCEICGQSLKKGIGVPPIAVIAGVAALALLGAGAYFFLNKPTDMAVTSTSQTINANPVGSPVIKVYNDMETVENVPSGLFNYGGSTTFAPLRSLTISNAITQAHPNFQLRYVEPTTGKPGSSTGIKMLLDGQLSIAQSSRSVKDSEFTEAKTRGFTLEPVPIAIDGIAFFVTPSLAIAGLSLGQVEAIFTGKVTNWNQVGGPNLSIKPFSRDPQSGGTVTFIKDEILHGQALGRTVQITRDTTDEIRKVAQTPGAISYATASEVIGQQTIRSLPLSKAGTNYVAPFDGTGKINVTAFKNSSYPITRRLFVVMRRDGKLDEQAGAAYANLLLSGQGQKLIEQSGFVAIR